MEPQMIEGHQKSPYSGEGDKMMNQQGDLMDPQVIEGHQKRPCSGEGDRESHTSRRGDKKREATIRRSNRNRDRTTIDLKKTESKGVIQKQNKWFKVYE